MTTITNTFAKCFSVSLMALATALCISAASAEEIMKDIFVVSELSETNQCATNQTYNERCTKLLLEEIDKLGLAYLDNLRLRTAGAPSSTGNYWPAWNRDIEFVFGKRSPEAATPFLIKRVRELSGADLNSSTDLVWSMEELAKATRCDSYETHIFILSNALEAGRFEGNKFGMPRLIGTPFEGCASLTLIGFGANDEAGSTTRLRSAEMAFEIVAKEAGFGRVSFFR